MKKIPLAGPFITQKEIDYVHDAVVNGWYETYDMHIRRLEERFAEAVGVKYAIATYCGTHALHLAALALQLGPGDEVIVADQSYIATAYAISYTGAECVFADVCPDTLCIDPAQIEQLITPRTKAVMVVHFGGFCCDMDAVMRIAEKHGFAVIEDACQSFGSCWHGRHTGTIGAAGAFSFQGSKIAVGGEGGMFVTNDENIYRRARHFGTFCRNDAVQYLWSDGIGYNYRISNLTAALILAQVERIDALVANKKRIFECYREQLEGHPQFELLVPRSDAGFNYGYVLGYLRSGNRDERDQLVDKLAAENIHLRPGYPSMHRMPPYSQDHPLPNSDRYDRCGLVLPSAHSLTETDIAVVCERLDRVLSGKTESGEAVECDI